MNGKFMQLQQREQIIIVVAAALLMAIFYYSIVWKPVYEAQINQRQAFALASQDKAVILDYVEQIQAIQESENSADNLVIENLTSHVNQSLQARQLSLTQIQQLSGDQVQLRLEDVPFNTVLAWLYDLENTPGLVLGELSIRPSDATQTGQVNITVGLSWVE